MTMMMWVGVAVLAVLMAGVVGLRYAIDRRYAATEQEVDAVVTCVPDRGSSAWVWAVETAEGEHHGRARSWYGAQHRIRRAVGSVAAQGSQGSQGSDGRRALRMCERCLQDVASCECTTPGTRIPAVPHTQVVYAPFVLRPQNPRRKL